MSTDRTSNLLQLDLFLKTLPARTWATDTLGAMRIVDRAEAAGRAYLAPNSKWEKWWLVFDVDRPTASWDWQDRSVPAPNLTATNIDDGPRHGHAHAFYGLAFPIHTDPSKAGKALRYGAAVESALRDALDGDISYGGPLAKNPLHTRWLVQQWQQEPYTLDWLTDYQGIDLKPYQDKRTRLPDYGLGRNVNTFNALRLWAYRHVLQAHAGHFSAWLDECIERAKWCNAQPAIREPAKIRTPLGEREIRGIAKSVARWTWDHFSYRDFSAIQRARGKKWNDRHHAEAMARRQLLLDFIDQVPGLSIRGVARIHALSETTVRRLVRHSPYQDKGSPHTPWQGSPVSPGQPSGDCARQGGQYHIRIRALQESIDPPARPEDIRKRGRTRKRSRGKPSPAAR